MTALDSALNPDHFERPDLLYSIKPPIVSGAALGVTSRQLSHASDFPVEHFTPGSPLGLAALTSANMAQSIRNAYAAAKAAGGGNVLIPVGHWQMGASGGLLLDGTGYANPKPVMIRGAASWSTVLEYPTPWTTAAIHLRGSNPGVADGEGSFLNGGLSGLSIFADADDEANTGVGIKIDGCISTTFADLDVRNFVGGKGWECRDYRGGNFNSQYIQFWNVRAAGNGRNYDFSDLTNCQAVGMYAASAREAEFFFGQNNMLAIYGGFTQGNAPTLIKFSGNGNNRVILQDIYFEGLNPDATVLLCETPLVGANNVELRRFHLGGTVAVFADRGSFTRLTIDTIYGGAGNAGKVLIGRDGNAGTLLVGCGTPQEQPELFDLDASSAADLTCLHAGEAYFSRVRAARGIMLAPYADGLEPASPGNGQEIFNTTTERPRVWGVARNLWSDVAFTDDPASLTDLLEPYAEAVFDPSVRSSVIVVGGTPDEASQLTDLLNGAVALPSGSGARPEYKESDPLCGGNATVVCDNADARYLTGSFTTPIPDGAYPGIFVVYYTIGGQTPDPRVVAQFGAGGSNALALLDSDDTFPGHVYGLYDTAAGGAALLDYRATDHFAHAVHLYASNVNGQMHMQVDRDVLKTISPAQNAIDDPAPTFYIGTGSSLLGSNLAIAYVAFLKSPLPSSVAKKALAIARARFSL